MSIPPNYIAIPGSKREKLPGAVLTGATNPDERMQVTVLLRRKGEGGSWSAESSDIDQVSAFATGAGLAVIGTSAARREVKLTGTVAQFEQAFAVTLNQYQYPEGTYRGRVGPIYIRQALASVVQGVFGLDNRPMAHPRSRLIAASGVGPGAVHPVDPVAGANSFSGPELARLYSFPTGVTGAGQCVGIIALGGGFTASDLTNYFGQPGFSNPPITTVFIDGSVNNPGDDDATRELTLDIEAVGSIAPGARIVVYLAPDNGDQSFINAVNTAVHDEANNPSVISISFGHAECCWTDGARQQIDLFFQEAGTAPKNITVCCASGDDGSTDAIADGRQHVDYPASSPLVLGCGGTSLRSNDNKDTIIGEEVWSPTGGGISDAYRPAPPYQAAVDLPLSVNDNGQGRGVPDVAGHAAAFKFFYRGAFTDVAGTSAVAPLWAGLVALLNQKLNHRVGVLNPVIYLHQNAFRDIKSGSNGAYTAVRADPWDACTGLGSPNGEALLQVLTP